ncbi:MAG TPA: hypothetical protein VEF04_20055 [Blastocatellia bacterium]|nr:hypothetical protein [Blastocatellia bacterium]
MTALFEKHGTQLAWQVLKALPAETWEGFDDSLHPEKIADTRFIAACEFVARHTGTKHDVAVSELASLIEAWPTVERGVAAMIAIYRIVRPADEFVIESFAERNYPAYGEAMRTLRQAQAEEYAHLKSPLDRGY